MFFLVNPKKMGCAKFYAGDCIWWHPVFFPVFFIYLPVRSRSLPSRAIIDHCPPGAGRWSSGKGPWIRGIPTQQAMSTSSENKTNIYTSIWWTQISMFASNDNGVSWKTRKLQFRLIVIIFFKAVVLITMWIRIFTWLDCWIKWVFFVFRVLFDRL